MLDNLGEEKPSGYYMFGTDVFTIPCFRTSFLAGFSALTGTSLLSFLFTSSSMRAFNHGFAAFVLATFPYMFYCQHNHFETIAKMKEIEDAVRARTNDDYLILDNLPDLVPDAVV